MKPQDKPSIIHNNSIEEPKLFIVVDDEKFPRPGLETSFVDYSDIDINSTENFKGCLCHPVGAIVCQCNKVRVCTCVGYTECSCVSDRSGSVVTGCSCAPVH